MSINELGRLFLEKTIDMKLLQQLLEYSDEKLFQLFDLAVTKKRKNLGDVIVPRDEIEKLRNLYENYQHKLDLLFKFYIGFCSAAQITDVNDDLQQHIQNSNEIKLKQVLVAVASSWRQASKIFRKA